MGSVFQLQIRGTSAHGADCHRRLRNSLGIFLGTQNAVKSTISTVHPKLLQSGQRIRTGRAGVLNTLTMVSTTQSTTRKCFGHFWTKFRNLMVVMVLFPMV